MAPTKPVVHDPAIVEFVSLVKKKIGRNLCELVLFGSRARNQHRQDSDYDYIIVVKQGKEDAKNQILDASVEMLDRYDILVSPQIYSAQEWEEEQRLPLGINVAREGIRL